MATCTTRQRWGPRARARLQLEALEARWLPATVNWTGLVNNDWHTGGNWDTLQVPGSGDDVIIGLGAAVQYSSGNTTIDSLTVLGQIEVLGGKLTTSEVSAVAALIVSGGELEANANLTVAGSFFWLGGTLDGAGTISADGTLVLLPGAQTTLSTTLSAGGTTNWINGHIEVSAGGSFLNRAGGTFNILTNDPFDPTFTNNGTVVANQSGTATFDTFNNSGTMRLQAGTVYTTGLFTQTGGSLQLLGGAFRSDRTLRLQGGWLGGAGTILASVSNTGGQVAPHLTDNAPHVLTIQGNYTQSAGGRMTLLLQGPSANGTADRVVITGTAHLGGALEVTLTGTPQLGDVYASLAANTRTGTFASVTVTPASGLTVSPSYLATGMNLVVVADAAPPPASPPGGGPKKPKIDPVPPAPIDDLGSVVKLTPERATPGGGGTVDDPAPAPVPGGSPGTSTGGTSNSRQEASQSDLEESPSVPATSSVRGGSFGLFGMLLTSSSGTSGAGSSTSRAAESSSGEALTATVVGWVSPVGGLGGMKKSVVAGDASQTLADELFAQLPVALPEAELPSAEDYTVAGELAAALLGGGRARANILPQRGSQLTVVAALVSGDEPGDERLPGAGANALDELFLHPLALANGSPVSSETEEGAVVRMDEEAALSEARPASLIAGRLLTGSAIVAAVLMSLALGPKERVRRTARPELRPDEPR